MKFSITLISATCLLALSACTSQTGEQSGSDTGAQGATAAPTSPTNAEGLLPMKTLMGHVIQHSAEEVWKWQGFVSDQDGEKALFPKNIKEWDKAENAALTLAEISDSLLHPARKVDDPRWEASTLQMKSTALELAEASEAQDKERLLELGGKLDESCKACHGAFAPWAERPLAQNF